MAFLQKHICQAFVKRYGGFSRICRRHAHARIQIWRPSPTAKPRPLPSCLLADVVRMRTRSYGPPFYVRPSLLKREKIISVALSKFRRPEAD